MFKVVHEEWLECETCRRRLTSEKGYTTEQITVRRKPKKVAIFHFCMDREVCYEKWADEHILEAKE